MYRLASGIRVYAVGDVHGRADLLDTLLARIAEDAAAAPEPERRLVFLGDYVDRGPGSREVIERLRTGPWPAGFTVTCLRGNHEDAFLRALADPEALRFWLVLDAETTLASYGVRGAARRSATPQGLAALHAELRAAVPDAHRDFLASLPLTARIGDYVFVHAGIRPGTPLEDQAPTDLTGIRDEFLDCADDHGCVVVHGHTISPLPENLPNRIGIDTGAFLTGRLTAAVLTGTERRFLDTAGPPRRGAGLLRIFPRLERTWMAFAPPRGA